MTDSASKLKLHRFLREENMRNRMHMRKREEILYGKASDLTPELYFASSDFGYEPQVLADSKKSIHIGIKARTVLSVLIFALVLYADLSGRTEAQIQTCEWVKKQLDWSVEAKLIDFMSAFPYTLSDEPKMNQNSF